MGLNAAGLVPGGGGSGGGGNTPGASIVRAFPFAFDTPNILTGAALYTPTIGDILLDAWFEIDTAWNGTTPLGDFGTFVSGVYGLLAGALTPYPMNSNADADDGSNTGLIEGETFGPFAAMAPLLSVSNTVEVSSTPPTFTDAALQFIPGVNQLSGSLRAFPNKVVAANPIKVVVSQDGTNTGDDPGSTQGAAILYLVTASPV